MKNRYNLTLCLFALVSLNLFGQGEQPANHYSTDDITATGWVEIKGNGILGTRTASIQSTSIGVTLTDWDGVFKIEPHGAHIDVTPRQGNNWTYGVSGVFKDTLYVPARYFAHGQGSDSSKVFISGNNGLSWNAVNGPVFSSSSLQVNSDIRFHADTLYLMGDDELFYSPDFGLTWVDISPTNLTCNFVNDILFFNGQVLLTGCSLGGVFKLDKNTITWARDFGFVFMYSDRFLERDSAIFLSGADDIQRKYLPTGNWQQTTNGLGQFHVYSHLNINQNLFITTSVGVFKTEDFGNSWTDFNSGWADPTTIYPVNMVVYGDTLFVASSSQGVYKQAIPPNPVSLNEFSSTAGRFKLYPNPATDYLTITSEKEGEGTYKIYDQSGKLMTEGEFKTVENVSLGQLKSGMYIVKLTQGNRIDEQKLLIK